MKKIFIVSCVKNESDIIESFCRYNLTYCDGMLIKDDNSSDNTKDILLKLIDEGLPIYLTEEISQTDKTEGVHKAIDEYGADLIVPLDADEFLYHIDGINPREALKALREDVEYQVSWRTYVYEKELDIKLGFTPHNFKYYRNPLFEQMQGHAGKTLVSKYLIKEKRAKIPIGSHWLLYPKEYQNVVTVENPKKLVIAHFPVRSQIQVMRKVIPHWIKKWREFTSLKRSRLDNHQLGKLFNDIRDSGEIMPEKMKQRSIEYSLYDRGNKEEISKQMSNLGDQLMIYGSMDISFCKDKLVLHYTRYTEDSKTFIRATLKEIDDTIMFLTSENNRVTKSLHEMTVQKEALAQTRFGQDFSKHQINEQAELMNEIKNIKNSIRYKIGEAFVEAAKSPVYAFKLPAKLVKLFIESKKTNNRSGYGDCISSNSVDMPTSSSKGIKINVGCGPYDNKKGWINVDIQDFKSVDIVMDVTKEWKFKDVDFIFAEHFLEHIKLEQGINFLFNAFKSLKIGGMIRLTTPNVEWVLKTHYKFGDKNHDVLLDSVCSINRAFYGWGHSFLYSEYFLKYIMENVGFENVKCVEYGKSNVPELNGLEQHRFHGCMSLLLFEGTKLQHKNFLDDAFLDYLQEKFIKYNNAKG